jgi:hypothetical protein
MGANNVMPWSSFGPRSKLDDLLAKNCRLKSGPDGFTAELSPPMASARLPVVECIPACSRPIVLPITDIAFFWECKPCHARKLGEKPQALSSIRGVLLASHNVLEFKIFENVTLKMHGWLQILRVTADFPTAWKVSCRRCQEYPSTVHATLNPLFSPVE